MKYILQIGPLKLVCSLFIYSPKYQKLDFESLCKNRESESLIILLLVVGEIFTLNLRYKFKILSKTVH